MGIIITGEEIWVRGLLDSVYTALQPEAGLWLTRQLPEYVTGNHQLVTRSRVTTLLGSESDCLVVDGFNGLNPDVVAALAGTLKSTGAMILLAPDLMEWGQYSDPEYQKITVFPHDIADIPGLFLQRLSKVVERYCEAGRFIEISQGAEENRQIISELGHFKRDTKITPNDRDATVEQQIVIEAVEKVCTGHRGRPLVLTADRGRGKSAAIGIALGRLMRQGEFHFLVTAPSLASVERLFFHLAETLGLSVEVAGELKWNNVGRGCSTARYCSPESVMSMRAASRILIVDEAAAIGTPMLDQWLEEFPRLVFSTTVHGYEGSGQGFTIRFLAHLKQKMPQYKTLTLADPIRWKEGDAVEAFLNEAFLLSADGYDDSEHNNQRVDATGACDISLIDRLTLIEDNDLLRQLFGLLVSAHYKTTPGDLRNLLDGPNLHIFLAKQEGRVVGALLLAEEGGFNEELAESIWRGQRRPRGHVIPQTLAVQCGYRAGLEQKSARIIRIAVHPDLQRNGLGKKLVDAVKQYATKKRFDWLGSSFGVTQPLLEFWRSCRLEAIRVGINVDVASGSYSALVLTPLCGELTEDFTGLQKQFRQNFLVATRNYYQRMPVQLLLCLMAIPFDGQGGRAVSDQVRRDVEGFISYQWPYDVVFPSLCQWVEQFLGEVQYSKNTHLDEDELALLVSLFVRQYSLDTVSKQWGKGGKKALLKRMKSTILNANSNN